MFLMFTLAQLQRVFAILAFGVALTVVTVGSMPASDPQASRTTVMDFSGIELFWEIQTILASGEEPAASVWDALFATPGYALLQAREHRREALITAFQIAFQPSAPKPARTGRQSEWVEYVVPHLQQVPRMRAQLNAYRNRIEHGAFLSSAIRRAQILLPVGTTERFAPPAISFVFFAPDGRGYPRLVIDLLHLLQINEHSEQFLAHELFHSYRNRIARQATHSFDGDLLMSALGNAEEEGIADQLDKSDIPSLSPDALAKRFPDPDKCAYFASYQTEFRRSEHWLQFVEKRLEEYALESENAADIGSRLHGGLPDNGRVLGAYMAATIHTELGKDRLLATVGDPIGFWRTYQAAAITSGGRAKPLSKQAMRVLDSLEKTHYPPPRT